ncbi:hypothetical protein L3Q82_005201 [Scortum barcoo]|uniref:Uncharacterized protein n=1 Tax=Scortum barcoo TaxID=214431 RepID=A0ACB8VAL9_9TELE|nr:hypothetical protein L3Q82_005201 [Scortum barcoo]
MLGLLQGKALTWAEASYPFFFLVLFTITQALHRRLITDYTLVSITPWRPRFGRTLAAEVDWTGPGCVPPSRPCVSEAAGSAVPPQFRPEIPNSPGGPPPNQAQILPSFVALRSSQGQSVPNLPRCSEEPMQGGAVIPGRRGSSLPRGTESPAPSGLSSIPGRRENFIDEQAAEQLQAGIPSEPLERPRNALAVDGRILAQFSLPPHRPYDCAIELLPDAAPSSRLPGPPQNLPSSVRASEVLQRLLENRLFVKKEKCEFHASQVDFLGFIIKEGCVQADPAKTLHPELQPRGSAPDSSHLPVSSLCLE